MNRSVEFYLKRGSIENQLALLEMSDACLWFIDTNFTLLAFNKIYVKHMQLFVNVVPKIGDVDIVLACFPEDFASGILKLYRKALAGEVVKTIDKGFKEDGTETDIMMIFKPVFDNNNSVTGVSCMRTDISEYLQIKNQLEEKEKRMSEIVWQQSHLYRGPLSTAMGIVNLLIEETSNRTLSDHECSELILAMKSKLLDLDEVIHLISKQAANR